MEFQVNVKTCTYLISMNDFFNHFLSFFFDFVSIKSVVEDSNANFRVFFPIIKVC